MRSTKSLILLIAPNPSPTFYSFFVDESAIY